MCSPKLCLQRTDIVIAESNGFGVSGISGLVAQHSFVVHVPHPYSPEIESQHRKCRVSLLRICAELFVLIPIGTAYHSTNQHPMSLLAELFSKKLLPETDSLFLTLLWFKDRDSLILFDKNNNSADRIIEDASIIHDAAGDLMYVDQHLVFVVNAAR